MKKRDGNIASMFQKNTAKKKSSSPLIPSTDVETDEEHMGSDSGSTPGPSLIPPPPPSIYDLDYLPQDPTEKLPIVNYPINDQDTVRRSYILKGPFKPYAREFKNRKDDTRDQTFNVIWLHKYL
jgi:hypothetical protein